MERTFQTIQAEMRETYAQLQNCKEEERAALQAKFENLKAEREIALGNEQAAAMQRETPKTFSLCKALREAMQSRKQFELRAALTAAGLANKAVEVEIQNILEPLYAKSVLQQLGVRWYKGMPMGDISIPVMNGGTVAWKAETGSTADGTRFALGSKLQSKDAINAVSDKDFIENYYFVEVRDKMDPEAQWFWAMRSNNSANSVRRISIA